MSYCPKCGTKVREEMSFCPKCGAALKVEQPPAEAPAAPYKAEKAEKHEKQEKREKGEKAEKREKAEKHEKREFGYIGSLIGGLILIFIGLMFYLALTTSINWAAAGAFIIVIIGILVIVGAVYAAMMASRRHPKPKETI
jgi:uncharacterized membrane protein YvbJ